MNFNKYGKLNNVQGSSGNKIKQLLRRHKQDGGVWHVQEKVHGSNFSIIYNGSEFRSGRRNGWIGEGQSFYNSEVVLEENKEYVKKIFTLVQNKFLNVKFISVFGELCGGYYPHPDVEEDKTSTKVQRGVYYSPN